MKNIWSDMGGKLAVGLISAGFLLIFLGWNGAASTDRIQSQFPYLISGGIAGLSFVIAGVGLMIVQNQREDRALLQQTIRELRDAVAEAGLAEAQGETRREFELPKKRPTPESMLVGTAAPAAPEPSHEESSPALDASGDEDEPVAPVRRRPAKRAPRKAVKKSASARKRAPRKAAERNT